MYFLLLVHFRKCILYINLQTPAPFYPNEVKYDSVKLKLENIEIVSWWVFFLLLPAQADLSNLHYI